MEPNREATDLIVQQKALLRQKMLNIRDVIPESVRSQKSQIIARQVLQIVEFQKPSIIMSYVSIRSEVETHQLIDQLIAMGKIVVAPLAKKETKDLAVYQISDRRLDLKRGTYGVPEPIVERCPPIDESKIDLILVPGVAFNRLGYRIGYGAGYYDRFLKRCSQTTSQIGLAYKDQIVDDVFQLQWDMPMSMLVSEEGILSFPNHSKFL